MQPLSRSAWRAWGYGALWIPEAIGREVFSGLGVVAGQYEQPDRRQRHRQYLRARSGLFGGRAEGPQRAVRRPFSCSGWASRTFLRCRACGSTSTASLSPPCVRTCKASRPTRRTSRSLHPRRAQDRARRARAQRCWSCPLNSPDGAHPYNVPPEHTRQAREILGAGKLLCGRTGRDPGDRSRSRHALVLGEFLALTWACPTT